MSGHTELPELAVGYMHQGLGHGHYAILRKESGELFANVPFGDKNLVMQVVLACNSYKKLLEACEEFIEVCTYLKDAGNDDDSTLTNAITAGHAAIKNV